MKKKYTEKDLIEILKLENKINPDKMESYQEGSCYDFALILSDFCIKNNIKHQLCELYTIEFDGFENRDCHHFVKIEDKVYDSKTFAGNENDIFENFNEIEGEKKIKYKDIDNKTSHLNSIGALSLFMKNYKKDEKDFITQSKKRYTKEDISNYLELEYYKSKGAAISYQTGGCFDLADKLSEFCKVNNIPHKLCELYSIDKVKGELEYKDWEGTFKELKLKTDEDIKNWENNNKDYIVERGGHYFIEIEGKTYDSFNFSEPDEEQIYYQFEDIEGFHFTIYYEIDINKEITNKQGYTTFSSEIDFYKLEIEKHGIEKLKMLYAIENNKNNSEYNYLHSLKDIPYYEELKNKKILNIEEKQILNDIEKFKDGFKDFNKTNKINY